MRTHTFSRLALAALLAFLVAGCVSLDDYQRKADEASGLRRELEATQGKVRTLTATNDQIKRQIEERRLENQELTESLTMARRHGQQAETGLSDLRSQAASQHTQLKATRENLADLQKQHSQAIERLRKTEAELVDVRKRLLRYEDRDRLQAQVEKDLQAQFAPQIKAGLLQVLREGDRVVLRISSAILFRSGHADIQSKGKKLLDQIAPVLRRYTNREIQVQGHTDNVQISNRLAERWETNWELSAARATRVLRYLVEVDNLDPRHASAAGLGEFSPIADNSTPEGRSKNRRIEIVIFPPPAAS